MKGDVGLKYSARKESAVQAMDIDIQPQFMIVRGTLEMHLEEL